MKKMPNILFLMSDEHRPDVTGYEGDTIVRTPVLDKIAKTGVVFRNAYTPSPVCIPARQCMMAGQLPKTCGCRIYGEDLKPGYNTFARALSRYGYETVVSGKLHHMNHDQMQGWTRRISGDMQVDDSYIEGLNKDRVPYYEGDGKWSDAKEIKRAGTGNGDWVVEDGYVVEGAIDYIDQYFNSSYWDKERFNRPLMLKVSLKQPHYPYITTEERFKYYLNRVNPYFNQEVFDHPYLSQKQVRPGVDATEREIRRATAAYYGMIETIDDHYGRVIQEIENAGQDLNDWIIIYTSDHGEMLGQHGVWEKFKFFEASVRVPLIIRWPNGFRGGRVVNENVNLCDLFATLCDLTDIPIPEGLDSRSLVPLLQGKSEKWYNETVSEYCKNQLMIKRDNLKYQYYGPDIPEVLFDLEKNPEETINYIDDPAYSSALKSFRERLGSLGHGPEADSGYINAGYVSK